MLNDVIEDALLWVRDDLDRIQRGHSVDFGYIAQRLDEALEARRAEKVTGQVGAR